MSRVLNEPIAIVGSACRFPGDANSPSKLWNILQDPKDLQREITGDRFSAEGFYHTNGAYHGHSNVKKAYLINDDLSLFDASFFGIKPVEAKAMDPQQRLLLEITYEALEAAGIPMADLRGSDTAVFVGAMSNDYGAMLLRDIQNTPTYCATGIGQSILSNRLSYFFDWHGPSVTLDTACSSSLVAIHMAVQALRSGESKTALACGSNLILGPENFIMESKLQMLSPDGRSRMWDQDANGYARGDGVASVVLKKLGDALADGDDIECVIRETSVGQDGATPAGLTVPSSSAQEDLIRSTYAKAGLEILTRDDCPQYFEAHGTGTPVGDPAEARAIFNTFSRSHEGDRPLYVGSIKSVFGHAEGAAGIAAVLKASLALQHGRIPPNLLFERLSDGVQPFYVNVEICKASLPWPDVDGRTRRASVNSFGFGGTNAHAILELYDKSPSPASTGADLAAFFTPFVFSAFSEHSLRKTLSEYAAYLGGDGAQVNLEDLAWTLRTRRSVFGYRAALVASSSKDLKSKIETQLRQENTSIGIKSLPASHEKGGPRLLGVFTGQGAQYARMGAELVEKSDAARRIIEKLESHLAQLPGTDAPAWSLLAELTADTSSSRVGEATLSQPLCTAVQILLVDLLQLAGVFFDVVIGHSSGEIAAAYAAGCLTAREAIIIAYYRGFNLNLASSPNGDGRKGAMLAVGSSMEDMTELCEDELFAGRVALAASNSPLSVTISGDDDAISELQVVLDDENKFNRRLKVDKAYHSRHMFPCFEPYVESLRRCAISPQKPRDGCVFISTVYNRAVDLDMNLEAAYWAENMTRPVLFSQALSSALTGFPCSLALEVGPHPALKSPAKESMRAVLGKELPYQGLLMRGTTADEATSNGLGFLWSHLDKERVNLETYVRGLVGYEGNHSVLKDLPTYSWSHEVKHWHESRSSRSFRTRQRSVHSLLGDVSPDSASRHISWHNILRVDEMEWLSGHRVQGQTVYPAAAYLATALEASLFLAEGTGKEIRLVDLSEFTIHEAITFESDNAGVEVLILMAQITRDEQLDRVRAKFTFSAALGPDTKQDLTLVASGDIEISLGRPLQTLLPRRHLSLPHAIEVEPDRFYASIADLGYNFTGRFRSLLGLRRRHGKATCQVRMRPSDDVDDGLMLHPAELDATLQAIILAYSHPYDRQLHSIYVPTSFQQIRINPALCGISYVKPDESLAIDSIIVTRDSGQRSITGDAYVYSKQCPHAAIQIQGASFTPLGNAPVEDSKVFSKVDWVQNCLDGCEAARDIPLTENHQRMAFLLERISTFYLRKFDREVPPDDPKRFEFPTNWYLKYARHIASTVENGQHKWARKEWLHDTLEDILEESKAYSETPDVQIMHLVGEQMPRVFRGETTILEHFREDDILDRYDTRGFGWAESTRWVGRIIRQLVDRYPTMNILEAGAGTGAATGAIFREIGQTFLSYTYTDISPVFLEAGSSAFSQLTDKMTFQLLDLEKSPLEQGFAQGTYDLIVAFYVIHATSDLERSLRNLRRLLKPGGYLVVGEGQEVKHGLARYGFIFGTLPGWWLGADSGRPLSPQVPQTEWDRLLKLTGFSGIDASPTDEFKDMFSVCHLITQAVDDQINFLREPLQCTWRPTPLENVVVIGGQSSRSLHLCQGLEAIFYPNFAAKVYRFETLVDVDFAVLDAGSAVISLVELDWPVFKDITPATFAALKTIFTSGKTLLWITSGRLEDEPFANMTVGFGRTAKHETPELHIQQLDIANPLETSPQTVAEALLRLHATVSKSGYTGNAEPEMLLDNQQRLLVSRLRPVPELNDRYNSARRRITQEVDVAKSLIEIRSGPNGYAVQAFPRGPPPEGTVQLETTFSTVSALPTPYGPKFLAHGVHADNGGYYLALVPSLASVLHVPSNSIISCPTPDSSSAVELLATIGAHLISMAVLDPLQQGQTVLAHNVTNMVAQALAAQGAEKNVSIVFSADATEKQIPNSWHELPPYSSQAVLKDFLHIKPSAFIGMSRDEAERSLNEAVLLANLPVGCHSLTAKTILSSNGCEGSPFIDPRLSELLCRALSYARQQFLQQARDPAGTPTYHLDNFSAETGSEDPHSIIAWTALTSLSVPVSRLDVRPLFKGVNGTYWVVGMTGGMGISLCDWMISKGARHIVLTSRNPDVAHEWIASHRKRNANIVVMPCDATDEAALKATHKAICDTLPPIVGVANGPMVLRDTAIRNMSFEELIDVVTPKVNSSIYLDRIFHDVDLDFFILISSLNSVVGNIGQANYAAGNSFLGGLAAHRRKRGLRAAAVNFGAITGAGFIERESSRGIDLFVKIFHLMRLSEEDWYQAVCETIDACRLDSPHGPELTTGLQDISIDSSDVPYWAFNPKFLYFTIQKRGVIADNVIGRTTASMRELVRDCQSQEELSEVIGHALADQLRKRLQVTTSDEEILAARSNDMGVDSLVSADIRVWFLKNLQISIPILKIMGNDTVESLVQLAVASVPAELVPKMQHHATR